MRIGSLFSGYGGLDQAVAEYTGATTAWVSDIDKGACKVLAHRYPDAPNIGDITTVNWSQVEPVDILTGGFPCQDVSHAGKRAGVRPGTRSGLWTQMCYAIEQLQPKLVVIENVRGLLSASAHSDLEPCPWCVGDGPDTSLRALGAVLGGLADIGYDARWCGLRAADVGAPHGRFRVFVVAYPRGEHGEQRREPASDETEGGWALGEPAGRGRASADLTLLPTPKVGGQGDNPSERRRHTPNLEVSVNLLLSPRATDGTKGGPNQRGSSGDLMLPSAVHRLLPTPVAAEGVKPSQTMGVDRRLSTGQVFLTNVIVSQFGEDPSETKHDAHGTWGDYAEAIARWELVNGPAPAPTMLNSKGNPRLSPLFVEWMMGLPAGWVTDVPAVSWMESLKLCGNGVVPLQALTALRRLLG